LGRQRLLFAIGHGGMSDVWLGLVSSAAGVDKLLVVKHLRASLLDDPEALAMFRDEARLAARLHHPNIVQTFEIGQEGPIPFMTMELLDGQPLHRVIRRVGAQQSEREPLSLGMRLRIVAELLEGLHYAHELRDYDGSPLAIVHRDVSPQNLFITYEGQIKLIDFGIATVSDSVTRSDGHSLKGKLAYMSPEQARGERVDRRTDVFAAGVMLWELISGRRLWAGESEATIVRALADAHLPALGLDALPDALARIVARALAPAREDRYESAEAMRSELEAFLEQAGIDVGPRAIGRRVAQAFADERAAVRARVDRELLALVGRETDTITPLSLWQGPWREPERGEWTSVSAIGSVTRAEPDEPTADYEPAKASTVVAAAGEPTRQAASRDHDALPARKGRARAPLVLLGLIGVASVALLARELARSDASPPPRTTMPAREGESEPALAVPPSVPLAAGCESPDKPIHDLSGDIDEDATLTCDREYLLRYETRVNPGVTLTIQPGTLLRGDHETKGLLLVQPGGRLIAEGTPTHPIVLTSDRPRAQAKPGDWGGLLLLGRAPVNVAGARVEGISRGGEFGGDRDDDDSGVLRYVRIEYAGMDLAPNNELNGLTLAGVGRGTTIDHVEVRDTTDDCFEFFGGSVDASHLVCTNPGDDAFDFDLGYRGELEHVIVRDHDRSGSGNGVEVDSDPTGAGIEPRTHPILRDVVLCGHAGVGGTSHALLVRRAAELELHGVRVRGYDQALELRDEGSTITGASIVLAPEQSASEVGEPDDDGGFDEAGWLARVRAQADDPGSFAACEPEFPSNLDNALIGGNDAWLLGTWLARRPVASP
jgi:serine/threonine-protein kinase